MEKNIRIPQAVHSDLKGFQDLLAIVKIYLEVESGTKITLDFHANTWFDANLLPVIYSVVELGRQRDIKVLIPINTRVNSINC